ARPRSVGRSLDRRAPRAPARGGREYFVTDGAKPTLLDHEIAQDGTERVHLRFEPDGAEVRVPSGTPIFDAASWNGVAIDSTCGGHGTCRKCKVQVLRGDVPVSALD